MYLNYTFWKWFDAATPCFVKAEIDLEVAATNGSSLVTDKLQLRSQAKVTHLESEWLRMTQNDF